MDPLAKFLLEHQPQINLKSYCSEVFACDCGRLIRANDNPSWKEWAIHVAEQWNFIASDG